MSLRYVAAVTFALSLACTPALSARMLQDTENVDRTVPFPANGTLKVDNFSGHVTITATSGRDVVVKAVRRGDRDRLDHIKLDISTSGSTVTINANKRDSGWTEHANNVVKTDLDIQVPAAATLSVNAFSSPVSVTGIDGPVRLKTFSAAITARDVKGSIDAESFSGKLDIDASAAGTAPDLSLKTFSGGISARLASGAHGAVQFDSFSGRFDSDLPLTLHSTSRRNLTADLPGGSGGHTLHLHTFSGDVKLSK